MNENPRCTHHPRHMPALERLAVDDARSIDASLPRASPPHRSASPPRASPPERAASPLRPSPPHRSASPPRPTPHHRETSPPRAQPHQRSPPLHQRSVQSRVKRPRTLIYQRLSMSPAPKLFPELSPASSAEVSFVKRADSCISDLSSSHVPSSASTSCSSSLSSCCSSTFSFCRRLPLILLFL